MRFSTLLITSLFFLSGCVSVSLKPSAGKRADNYDFQEPKNPFSSISNEGADHAWQSKTTGNTLVVMSECSSNDPSLEILRDDTLNAMSKPDVVTSETTQFLSRTALETHARGTVDGVAVEMKNIITKRNGCQYNISYVGAADRFQEELVHYENFKKGFKIK